MVGPSTCELRGVWSACQAEPIGFCQYCGRFFCGKHGVVLPDGQEICNRKFCVAKREDLKAHLVYRADVSRRNEEQRCGIEGCGGPVVGHCSRCNGFFCLNHVEAREELVLENRVRVTQIASLCRHCWVRRPIWVRT